MPDKRTPLATALAALLNSSGWSMQDWADFLNCEPESLEACVADRHWLSDQQMTSILAHLGNISGTKLWGERIRAALDQFWDLMDRYEGGAFIGGDKSFDVRFAERAERITKFTNASRVEGLASMIFLIPARRREAFLEEVTTVFNRFAEEA